MKKTVLLVLMVSSLLISCTKEKPAEVKTEKDEITFMPTNDERVSLKLNAMQKQHQLKNMRSHLVAIQDIIKLLSEEKYEVASKLAYTQLGSTTEMRLMCASFGSKEFENLGLSFHKSADEMSEIFTKKDKNNSLKALSKTMNYCVQCHATYRQ